MGGTLYSFPLRSVVCCVNAFQARSFSIFTTFQGLSRNQKIAQESKAGTDIVRFFKMSN